MKRIRASSGSPFEKSVGFSRAVRVGERIVVSGTAPIAADGTSAFPGDAYRQAQRCLEIIKSAIEELGGKIEHVTRTRIYITDASVWEDVGRAHGEMFADVRPAATMVVVAALLRDDWLVEIEAEAIVSD